jgi:hypothetical protein
MRRPPDRGGDRAAAAATFGVFLNTARSDGIEYQKRTEEMNESRQTVAARKPVRRGGGDCGSRMLRRSVRGSAAAAIGVQRKHQTLQVQARSREVAAVQEKDNREVAADGAAGDCVFAGEPSRRLLQIGYRTYWVRGLQQPRSFHSGPVRRGAADRTTRPGMSSRDGELKGESNEPVANGGIEPRTSPRSRRSSPPTHLRGDC